MSILCQAGSRNYANIPQTKNRDSQFTSSTFDGTIASSGMINCSTFHWMRIALLLDIAVRKSATYCERSRQTNELDLEDQSATEHGFSRDPVSYRSIFQRQNRARGTRSGPSKSAGNKPGSVVEHSSSDRVSM